MNKLASMVVGLVLSVGFMQQAQAEEGRNPEVIKQFKETNICPSTGHYAVKGVPSSYKCPGYVVDHGIPFCAGKYLDINLDMPHNLFYQKHDKENSLRKDSDERRLCEQLRKLKEHK